MSTARKFTIRIGRVDGFFPRRCPNGCTQFVVVTEGGGQAPARVRETLVSRMRKRRSLPSLVRPVNENCETAWSAIMPKYLLIFRESKESPVKPSPEEMQALQQAWYAWMQKYSSAIVGGDGLKPSGRLVKAGIVTDGPYVEAKEVIASFSMIQADNLESAVAIARECPYCEGQPAIEIRELAGYA